MVQMMSRYPGVVSSAAAIVAAVCLAGCELADLDDCETYDTCDPPQPEVTAGVQGCDLHVFQGSPVGVCVPHVGAGWHTALVRMAHMPKDELRCPDSAPFPGLSGQEVTPLGVAPRRVIGCSVQPLATCTALSFACVPFEQDYPACVNQEGSQSCPTSYAARTLIEKDGEGGTTTICCMDPPIPR